MTSLLTSSVLRHAKAPDETPSGRRWGRVVGSVTAVVLVLGAGGGAGWRILSERELLADDLTVAQDVLDDSADKVADPATREALADSVAEAEETLADRLSLGLVVSGSGEQRDALGTTSDAVRVSMVDLARSELTAVREGLAAVVPEAESLYTATDGLGADDARAGLRSALDAATSADGAAVAALEGTDVPALEESEAALTAQRDAVTGARDGLLTAQDALTCPAPDQLWSPLGGKVADAELVAIPWAPSFRIRADVLPGLVELDAAYQARFGSHLTLNSAYRTYEDQSREYANNSVLAAAPGCSNHGLGVAADFGGGVQTFGSPQYDWLKANAGTYGWEHPSWAEPGGRLPEPWHWQSVLAPAETR